MDYAMLLVLLNIKGCKEHWTLSKGLSKMNLNSIHYLIILFTNLVSRDKLRVKSKLIKSYLYTL